MKNLIELARECGAMPCHALSHESWTVTSYMQFTESDLQAFANAILEEAAKKCDRGVERIVTAHQRAGAARRQSGGMMGYPATHERRQLEEGNNMNDQAIEQEGLTAPRVTPADIEANIIEEHFFRGSDAVGAPPSGAISLLTFCVLVLKNGFTVTGESACASPENFDAELGKKIARQNAVAKVWPLMGYALKERLAA